MTYGCIAQKLTHSFSKDIHNKLFDYSYSLKEIPENELDAFMKKRDFSGVNVTLPFKERVIPYLDFISDKARKIGAVNTVVNENGFLKGYNTDFSGLAALIKKNNIDLKNKKVLILGSGGTSKTAFAVAEALGCSCVYRVSRDGRENCITYTDAALLHNDAEIIINTTPVGMYPKTNATPINLDNFPKVTALIDVVYNPLRTKLVCDALKRGITAVGGLYMLVAQAAFAGEKFTNTTVEETAIDRVYNELLTLKENVVLVGMPGSGKSTIGKILSESLGRIFIDTDKEIEKREQKSITEIFEEVSEAGFRKIEGEVIAALSATQNAVIATGGGAVLNEANISLLKQNGMIYFIDRPLESIKSTYDRPLSSNRSNLEKRYNERYELYCKCADKHIKIGDDPIINTQIILKDFKNENTCD